MILRVSLLLAGLATLIRADDCTVLKKWLTEHGKSTTGSDCTTHFVPELCTKCASPSSASVGVGGGLTFWTYKYSFGGDMW